MENTLGKRIAELRKQKELKQEDLANALGVSPQAVSKWENDLTCPDISLLPELARILGVSIDELLTGKGKQKEEPKIKILPPEERKKIDEMMLKIVVESRDGDHVRVNLPMALAQVALDAGVGLPQFSGSDFFANIDLAKIIELVNKGAIGNLVEMESADGDTVRIFVE